MFQKLTTLKIAIVILGLGLVQSPITSVFAAESKQSKSCQKIKDPFKKNKCFRKLAKHLEKVLASSNKNLEASTAKLTASQKALEELEASSKKETEATQAKLATAQKGLASSNAALKTCDADLASNQGALKKCEQAASSAYIATTAQVLRICMHLDSTFCAPDRKNKSATVAQYEKCLAGYQKGNAALKIPKGTITDLKEFTKGNLRASITAHFKKVSCW